MIRGCSSPQDDTTLKCWGANTNGNLGLGFKTSLGDDPNGPCPPSSTTASRVLGLRASCRPCVSSLLLLLSVCRDGGEPPFGRPGGWEDGRGRQLGAWPYVRSAGKAIQREIREAGTCKVWRLNPTPIEPLAAGPQPPPQIERIKAGDP